LATVSILLFIAATQSADPWLGTWKVELAHSTYSRAISTNILHFPARVSVVQVARDRDGVLLTIGTVK